MILIIDFLSNLQWESYTVVMKLFTEIPSIQLILNY